MVHASLFSGIGGPEVAAAMLGWENAFHCEINPFGKGVLDYWFPNSESYEDITKTDFTKWYGKIDVLTGGFPCQPFSYAGKRGGREDERYLWPEMLRAIDEIRPTWVVGENVAGITTMVEGGILSELGEEASLFAEGDDILRYELIQSFTIERICSDLEHIGYSVQPMLIPAAAVGAPHRRDRVFILAYDADADSRHDKRGTGEDERESVCEGVQERDEVRLARIADKLRSEIQGITENSVSDGPGIGEDGEQGNQRDERDLGAGNDERVCGEERIDSTNAHGWRSGEIPAPVYSGVSDGNESLRDGSKRYATDSDRAGREESFKPGRGNSARYDWAADPRLLPEYRWKNFPAVSPVHRGNDGIPIRMDDLSISFSKWRTESLKAYGNAIVPQVMYRIFEAIEKTQK